MLKHILIAMAALAVVLPASAQNAGQISKVRNGQSCPGCNLFQADLAYYDASNVDVSGARLRQSDMQLATFDNWNFTGTNLSVANLFGARFNRSNFTNANFENATLVGAYFGSSRFQGANFSGANVSGADFHLSKGLTQSQLNKACGDASTRLPAGLSVPRCR
ncbi:pentapeptide repeat-containing protein [Henriciella litoralis]|uniref:pentapeptide repeat-containing protein n=1 Tax=Henriciella litoralis TaxID=568102 RepID=UPI00111BF550|nr:pentapeptide repeat-containing protein [Henriciella litoralis]